MAGMPMGWFADPTGRSELRYWNGNAWTDDVARGGLQSKDPITGDYASPSVATAIMQRPNQPKKAKWPWIVGGIFLAFVLLGGGCALILGVAVNNAVTQLNAEQAAHAITKSQFDAVPLGTSQADVIRTLGKTPENAQEFVNKGVLSSGDIKSSCIYYNKSGGSFGDRFQFCFTADKLDTKNAY